MKLLFAIGLSYIASLAQSGAIPNVIETKTNIVTRLTQRNQLDIHCTDIVGCCPVIQNCTDNVLKILPNRKVRAVVAASRGCVNKIPCGCSSRGDMCTEDDKGYYWDVYWGDGHWDYYISDNLEPYRIEHQYSKPGTYYAGFFLCSNPKPGCYSQMCCDTYLLSISVTQ